MQAIFIGAIFCASFLGFFIQPLIGKMVLPFFGGGPLVWNTCMVFFQFILLLGYLYAHVSTKVIPKKIGVLIHLCLLLISLFFLPTILKGDQFSDNFLATPQWSLIILLFAQVGIPYFLLSSSAPLISHWHTEVFPGQMKKSYNLYSASNMGSLGALLVFPFLFEPLFSVPQGLTFLFIAILFLGLSKVAIGSRIFKLEDSPEKRSQLSLPREFPLRWILPAFLASSHMYGVSAHISTNIAAVPLLWIIPLSLYLVTFILTFSDKTSLNMEKIGRVYAFVASALVIISIVEANHPTWLIIPFHLAGLFLSGLVCHGYLYKMRPEKSRLTEFYLWISLGGVLGGAFNTLLSPLIFDRIIEYPLVLILILLCRQDGQTVKLEKKQFVYPILLFLLITFLLVLRKILELPSNRATNIIIFGIPLILAYRKVLERNRFVICLMALFTAYLLNFSQFEHYLHFERNFFGVTRVNQDKKGDYISLIHGDTVHGMQARDIELGKKPLTYYGESGPVGDVFSYINQETASDIAIMGLGAGTVVTYAKAHQDWVFYEINPDIISLAKNPEYFRYLNEAPTSKLRVVAGDARLSIEKESDKKFDLIFMDTFSSDAIPVHLVTFEALEIYKRKMKEKGMLLFNISNRYINMGPSLCKLGEQVDYKCLSRVDIVSEENQLKGYTSSRYLILFPNQERIWEYFKGKGWKNVKGVERIKKYWTDQYSNILETLATRSLF